MAGPADYLPSGTVGQWLPAPVQRWTVQKGGDPGTDHAIQGTTHDQKVLSNHRGYCTKGGSYGEDRGLDARTQSPKCVQSVEHYFYMSLASGTQLFGICVA